MADDIVGIVRGGSAVRAITILLLFGTHAFQL